MLSWSVLLIPHLHFYKEVEVHDMSHFASILILNRAVLHRNDSRFWMAASFKSHSHLQFGRSMPTHSCVGADMD